MIVSRRLRLIAEACGAVRPIASAAASSTPSGTSLSTISGNTASSRPLASPTGTSTRRWPYRSTRAPIRGPAMTTPMPTAAEVSPPSPTDPVAATTSMSTPTVIIANGRRAMKAIGQ